jgi:hypothetical protein
MNANQIFVAVLAIALTGFQANATLLSTNVARSGEIADSSGSFNNNISFAASKVIDGSIDEGTNAPTSYWIAQNGLTNAYFILDLLGTYTIESFVLYNTHDRQSYARGTGKFILFAGNALSSRGSGVVDRYYPLNGTLSDHTASGSDGVFYDALLAPTAPSFSTEVPPVLTNNSQSIVFSGGGEFLEMRDPPGFYQPSSYTISVWVRFDSVHPCSIVVRTSAAGEYTTHSHQIRVTAGGQFEAYLHDGAEKSVVGTTVAQPGIWYHVVAMGQNGGYQRLYVNGVEEGTPTPVGAMWQAGDRWRVGTGSKGGYSPFMGKIDDLAIWFSAPLTPAMITRLKNGESPTTVIGPSGGGGLQIADAQVAVSGSLTQVEVGDPVIPPQPFPLPSPISARYIMFQALEPYNPLLPRVGLNEIEVIARVDLTPPAVATGKGMTISWPHTPFAVIPETVIGLSGSAWVPVAEQQSVSDTTWNLHVRATNDSGFFRLRTP